MIIKYDNEKYGILEDSSILNTAVRVTRISNNKSATGIFDCEYALSYRRKNGNMTSSGLRTLGMDVIEGQWEELE